MRGSLRGDQERCAHLVPAEKNIRCQQCDRVRGGKGCFAHTPGSGGNWPTVATMRPSSRGLGVLRIPGPVVNSLRWQQCDRLPGSGVNSLRWQQCDRLPGSGGKEPPVAAMRPSSRGLGVVRTPGSGGKEATVAAIRPSSRGTKGDSHSLFRRYRAYGGSNATFFAGTRGASHTVPAVNSLRW